MGVLPVLLCQQVFSPAVKKAPGCSSWPEGLRVRNHGACLQRGRQGRGGGGDAAALLSRIHRLEVSRNTSAEPAGSR